jgi:DNA-binding response OmpR family regulator/DNA-binding transcriptional ArsR family regulator
MNKVLIIEDNFEVRENIAEMLKLADYEVFTAANGKSGVELALKHVPNIILCDIMMEELDGYGVIFMLSKHKETCTIPFIFITAKTQRQDLRKAMEMGADDYLLKPFNEMELLNAIESRLKKRKQQKNFYIKPLKELDQLASSNDGMPELKKFIEETKSRTFKKKQVIFYEGDKVIGIYLIHKGKIKTNKIADDGRELTTGIYNVEQFVGLNTMFSSDTYNDNAIVLEDCTLSFFPIQKIETLIRKYPDIAGEFIKILSNDVSEKEDQLLNLAYSSVRKRIAETLVNYSNQHCSNGEKISLSRNEIANLSGTSPESVSRTLTEFENEGLICKERNELKVLNLSKLSKFRN